MYHELISFQDFLITLYEFKSIDDLPIFNELIKLENLVKQLLISLKLHLNLD